ncbi:hypothetical protein KM043_011869 [Ampulex compressa]|nr:hypothetical protein KM043_011869 [Ampulex compressa]
MLQVYMMYPNYPLKNIFKRENYKHTNIFWWKQMYHYKTYKNSEHNYFLLEFQQAQSVNLLLQYTKAFYGNVHAAIKTPIFRFRSHNSNIVYSDSSLNFVNEINVLNDKILAGDLVRAVSISDQIRILYDGLKLTELETKLRFYTICQLEKSFSYLLSDMLIYPFGSSVNGFGNHCCDLDLVAVIEQNQKASGERHKMALQGKSIRFEEKSDIKEFLWVLAKMLQHFMPGVGNVQHILEARVPIIKFDHFQTSIECDLTLQNISGVYMSELLYLYGQIDNRVRPLIFTIRKWAERSEITHKNPGPWITNFSLSLLVLFYLQQKQILPTVQKLRSYASHTDIRTSAEGGDYTFIRDLKKIPNTYEQSNNRDSLEILLLDFFQYYNKFNFDTNELQKMKIQIQTALLSFNETHAFRGLISLLSLSKYIPKTQSTTATSTLSKPKLKSNNKLPDIVKDPNIEVPAAGYR